MKIISAIVRWIGITYFRVNATKVFEIDAQYTYYNLQDACQLNQLFFDNNWNKTIYSNSTSSIIIEKILENEIGFGAFTNHENDLKVVAEIFNYQHPLKAVISIRQNKFIPNGAKMLRIITFFASIAYIIFMCFNLVKGNVTNDLVVLFILIPFNLFCLITSNWQYVEIQKMNLFIAQLLNNQLVNNIREEDYFVEVESEGDEFDDIESD